MLKSSDDFKEARLYIAMQWRFSQANTTDFYQERHQEESAKNHKARIGEIISKIVEGVMDVIFHNQDIRNMCCNQHALHIVHLILLLTEV